MHFTSTHGYAGAGRDRSICGAIRCRRAKLNARLLIEAAAIFVMLMRGVPDPALRREYRRRMLRVIRHRPTAAILQLYAIKCAMHFHIQMMVQEMLSTAPQVTRAAA